MAHAVTLEETAFETDDPEVAREFLGDAYGDNQLRVKAPIVEDGVVKIHRVAATGVNVSEVRMPGELEMTIGGLEDEVLIATMHEGTASIDHRGWCGQQVDELGPNDVAVTNHPGVEWVHRTHPLRNTTIGLGEDVLREVAGADPRSSDPFLMTSTRPRPRLASLWRETSGFIERLMRDPAVASAPLIIGPARRFAAAAALTVFPNNLVADATASEARSAHPEIVRRAIAFIESNPAVDMSVADIAGAAHAGPRAVHAGFRRHLDTTPLAYLRRVRLGHVREELLAASPDGGETVASVAMRWGFRNQGRMAAMYRAEFGENPSATLRR